MELVKVFQVFLKLSENFVWNTACSHFVWFLEVRCILELHSKLYVASLWQKWVTKVPSIFTQFLQKFSWNTAWCHLVWFLELRCILEMHSKLYFATLAEIEGSFYEFRVYFRNFCKMFDIQNSKIKSFTRIHV